MGRGPEMLVRHCQHGLNEHVEAIVPPAVRLLAQRLAKLEGFGTLIAQLNACKRIRASLWPRSSVAACE